MDFYSVFTIGQPMFRPSSAFIASAFKNIISFFTPTKFKMKYPHENGLNLAMLVERL